MIKISLCWHSIQIMMLIITTVNIEFIIFKYIIYKFIKIYLQLILMARGETKMFSPYDKDETKSCCFPWTTRPRLVYLIHSNQNSLLGICYSLDPFGMCFQSWGLCLMLCMGWCPRKEWLPHTDVTTYIAGQCVVVFIQSCQSLMSYYQTGANFGSQHFWVPLKSLT